MRRLVVTALAKVGIGAAAELVEGPHPSPTLLIDGVDVTGGTTSDGPCRRLDIPTEDQITNALTRAVWRLRPSVGLIVGS